VNSTPGSWNSFARRQTERSAHQSPKRFAAATPPTPASCQPSFPDQPIRVPQSPSERSHLQTSLLKSAQPQAPRTTAPSGLLSSEATATGPPPAHPLAPHGSETIAPPGRPRALPRTRTAEPAPLAPSLPRASLSSKSPSDRNPTASNVMIKPLPQAEASEAGLLQAGPLKLSRRRLNPSQTGRQRPAPTPASLPPAARSHPNPAGKSPMLKSAHPTSVRPLTVRPLPDAKHPNGTKISAQSGRQIFILKRSQGQIAPPSTAPAHRVPTRIVPAHLVQALAAPVRDVQARRVRRSVRKAARKEAWPAPSPPAAANLAQAARVPAASPEAQRTGLRRRGGNPAAVPLAAHRIDRLIQDQPVPPSVLSDEKAKARLLRVRLARIQVQPSGRVESPAGSPSQASAGRASQAPAASSDPHRRVARVSAASGPDRSARSGRRTCHTLAAAEYLRRQLAIHIVLLF